MIRRPPRSTLSSSSAASDVYKRQGSPESKITSPARRRQVVGEITLALEISERRTCRAIQQPRSSQRYQPLVRNDEELLTQRITTLAAKYGRYGYRRITAMLQFEGWQVNHKRVERIWRYEGLKVPQRQPKRGHLWLNDGSCVRLRAAHPNHVWSYDFVMDKTHDGRPFRTLNIIDEFSRENPVSYTHLRAHETRHDLV